MAHISKRQSPTIVERQKDIYTSALLYKFQQMINVKQLINVKLHTTRFDQGMRKEADSV